MKEFETILKDELNKFVNGNPGTGVGTITGMLTRLNYIKDNIPQIGVRLNELANSYCDKNNLSKEDQVIVDKITLNTFNDFIKSFAS